MYSTRCMWQHPMHVQVRGACGSTRCMWQHPMHVAAPHAMHCSTPCIAAPDACGSTPCNAPGQVPNPANHALYEKYRVLAEKAPPRVDTRATGLAVPRHCHGVGRCRGFGGAAALAVPRRCHGFGGATALAVPQLGTLAWDARLGPPGKQGSGVRPKRACAQVSHAAPSFRLPRRRACVSSGVSPRTSTLTWTRQHVWRVHALRVHGMCMTCVWRVHGMRTACAQLAHSARPTRTYRPTVAASPTHRYLWLQPLYSNPPLPTVAASPTHRYLRLQPLQPTVTGYLRLQPLQPTVTYGCRPSSTRSRSTTTSRRQASSRPSAGPRTLAPATA